MLSFQAKLLKALLRLKFIGLSDRPIQEQRARQEKSTKYIPLPRGIVCEEVQVKGLSSEWITPPSASRGVMLYLHGGAYSLGSVAVHRDLIARLAVSTQRKALAINYRLAPEDPFPAALEDVLAAFNWLLEQGVPAQKIVIAGDSAGGGLTLAALVSLRDSGRPLPCAAVCFSPWMDLTLSGSSFIKNAKVDLILGAERLKKFARVYAGDHDLSHPMLSPLFADLQGLPPVLIQAGSAEVLLDDSVRTAEKIRSTQGRVDLQIWDGMFHVFQMFSFLPEAARALEKVAEFLSDM